MRAYSLVFIATSLAVTAHAEVKVEKIDYKGWAGSYKVSNGTVELVVVPQIGRIMSYGYVDGQNLLWQNETLLGKTFPADARTYRNYGGDKLWAAPQKMWNWPPDPALDGTAWQVEPMANGVRMTSGVGAKTKVKFRREITLSTFGTEVTFRNSMENQGPREEMGVWQVTQVNDPAAVTMPIEVTPNQSKGWHGFGQETLDSMQSLSGRVLTIRRDPNKSRKFGARSLKGTLTAAIGSTRFISESSAFAKVPYPDNGSAQQVYLSADPDKYVELEHAGPLTRMVRGEMVLQTVKWRLEKG